MTSNEAARRRLQQRRAMDTRHGRRAVEDFSTACKRLPLMFGGMFAVMYALIASGVVA